jgi:uncharacterized protein
MRQTVSFPLRGRATTPPQAARHAVRVAAIDILRGFALFGILLIHVPVFAFPGAPPGYGFRGDLLDTLLLDGLILFVEAKFFSLFAALFGVSFALQRQSAAAHGQPFVPRFRRRLLFLGLFGALHIALLWEGDILLLYALAGLLLIPFRDAEPARLLRWALGLLALPLLLYLLALAALALARLDPRSAALLADGEAQFSAAFAAAQANTVARYAGADPALAAVGRVLDYLAQIPLLLLRLPTVLAMFLFGFAVGRAGLLHNLDRHVNLLRRVRAWGIGVGVLASLLVTIGFRQLPPFAAFTILGVNQAFAGPVLALGYAAALLLLARRRALQLALAPLAGYGRVALSAYLLQSALCGLLFYGYGFSLAGQLSPLAALALALLLNGALIALSGLWLRRFRVGPAEWLWRSLVAGEAQALRRDTPRPSVSIRRREPAREAR